MCSNRPPRRQHVERVFGRGWHFFLRCLCQNINTLHRARHESFRTAAHAHDRRPCFPSNVASTAWEISPATRAKVAQHAAPLREGTSITCAHLFSCMPHTCSAIFSGSCPVSLGTSKTCMPRIQVDFCPEMSKYYIHLKSQMLKELGFVFEATRNHV